jgi:hypothetical protein
MKKAALPVLILVLICFVQVSRVSANSQGHKPFTIGLYGGYNALPMMVNDVDWKSYTPEKEEIDVSDDSFLHPAPAAGLAFMYLPAELFVSTGFSIEGFYQRHQGTFKGAVGNNSQNQEAYNFHMAVDFYQLNFLCTFYFTQKAFKPYLQLGLGGVRSDMEIGSFDQTAYGAVGVISWGGQYSFTDWFAFGGQVRTQDFFGLTYFFEPSAQDMVTIESQIIPLSFLLHTSFSF